MCLLYSDAVGTILISYKFSVRPAFDMKELEAKFREVGKLPSDYTTNEQAQNRIGVQKAKHKISYYLQTTIAAITETDVVKL